MKKNYLLLIVLSTFTFGFGQTIVTIDRANDVEPTATDNVASMSSIGLTRGPGTIQSLQSSSNFATASWTVSGDQATAAANNDYIEWSVTANSAFDVAVDELDIRLRRNPNGPTNWQIFYSLDNFSTPGIPISGPQTIGNAVTTDYNFSGLGITSGNSGTVTFRLYGWGALFDAGWLRVIGNTAWAGSLGIPNPGVRLIGSVSTGTANSIESDIVATSTFFPPTQNIDYTDYDSASGLTIFNAFAFGEFTIRDGGASGSDSDTEGTVLTSVTFDVANSENIAALAIFDGFTNVAEITTVNPITTFSSLNLVAPDNLTKTFLVFATFKSTVTDNEQIQLTVNTVTTPASGSSLFAAANAGGAATSIAGDDNRIEVTASEFVFNQQPTDGNQGEIMVPFPTISALDDNLNLDLDANAIDIEVATISGPSSIVGETYTSVNGMAVLDKIVFTGEEINRNLIVTSNSLSISGISTSFNIDGPLISIAEQNFDTATNWSYTTDRTPFGTVSDWGGPIGYFGEIALADAAPIDNSIFSNVIFGENDLNDVPTNPFATLTFADVDVTSQTNLRIEFDWQVVGYSQNASDIQYRLILNGVVDPAGWQFVFDGDGPISDDQGRVKINIPDGNTTVGLQVRLRNNFDDGYSGFDNFKIVSPFEGLIYTDSDGWTDNIEPDATTGALDALIIDGTYNLSGNVEINNFLLRSGAQTIIPLGQSLTVNGNLDNDGDIQLQSSSDTYSSLIVNGSSSGSVTYNRHVNVFQSTPGAVTGDNDLVAAPVTNDSQDFLALRTANPVIPSGTIGGVPSFLFGPFDNNTNAYVNYTAANDTDLVELGIGYRTASTTPGGSTFTFLGDVETGTVTVPITVGVSDFNLIGNPYPSYISLSGFLADNNDQFNPDKAGVYGYDGAASDGFTVWNLAFSESNPNAAITPGQGFLVSSQTGGGSVTFSPSIRRTGTSDDFIVGRNSNTVPLNAFFKLKISNQEHSFNTDFYFSENATSAMDIGYDAAMFNDVIPDFAIYSHLVENNTGIALAVQSVSYDSMSDIVIPIGINANQGEQLTVSISDTNLPENVNVYLEDNVTNTFTLLNTNDYVFTPNIDLSETGRFFLRFSSNALSTSEDELKGLEIFTNASPKQIVIRGQLSGETTMNVYDIQGRVVKSEKLNQNRTSQGIDVANLGSGVYVVQLKSADKNRTQKVIIN